MTRSRLEYRTAKHTDAHDLVEICARFHAESWQSFADHDHERMHEWMVERIDCENTEIFMAFDGSEIAGVMVGLVFCFPYSNTLVAGDYIWYVAPKYRGGMTGVRLLRMYEEWARSKDVANIMTGVTSGIRIERGAQLLSRLGYSPAGTIMQKDV